MDILIRLVGALLTGFGCAIIGHYVANWLLKPQTKFWREKAEQLIADQVKLIKVTKDAQAISAEWQRLHQVEKQKADKLAKDLAAARLALSKNLLEISVCLICGERGYHQHSSSQASPQ